MTLPLPTGPYSIIYADPPWSYGERVQHGGAGKPYTSCAGAFYPTMSVEDICALPVREILAPKAILFLWTTGPLLAECMPVFRAWGFRYKTVAFVWDKLRVNPGAYTMSQCEYCLVGVRGGIPKPRGARNVRQLVQYARTTHSTKPAAVRTRIDAMFPGTALKRVELFARTRAIGWDAWGNEI
jgi:N6-adenosine-specific RNA methylase IME4